MLTGQGMWMTEPLLRLILVFLAQIPFLKAPRNNELLLAHRRKLNTVLLPMLRLKLCGWTPYFMNSVFHSRCLPCCYVTILAPRIWVLIQLIILAWSIFRLIYTLSESLFKMGPFMWFMPNWCLSWFMSSWCSLIEGVINKIYNLLHHLLG